MSSATGAGFAVLNRQRSVKVDTRLLRRRITLLLAALDPLWTSVSVVLVSDQAIRRLNRRFLSEDRPTDVLAFRLGRRLGEIIISAETAAANAPAYGHSIDEEIFYLVIHGLLHLKGMSDQYPAGRRRMMERQNHLFSDVLRQEGRHCEIG